MVDNSITADTIIANDVEVAPHISSANLNLVKITAWVVMVVAVSLSLYQLYTAGVDGHDGHLCSGPSTWGRF